ncbi:MAG: CoA pyrophosphatase [Rhodocyclaceae bacterium]
MTSSQHQFDATVAGWRERIRACRRAPGILTELTEPARAAIGLADALQPAAVLIPLVVSDAGTHVLLTRRTDHLKHHPGQISFPGGRAEDLDASVIDTALREAREEVGLAPECVDVLGSLPDYFTGTGFRITPVVGVTRAPLELRLDTFEVAEAFEVPLDFLMDPANHQRHRMEYQGRMREYYAMPYGEYYIWGATAGMLVSMSRILRGEAAR